MFCNELVKLIPNTNLIITGESLVDFIRRRNIHLRKCHKEIHQRDRSNHKRRRVEKSDNQIRDEVSNVIRNDLKVKSNTHVDSTGEINNIGIASLNEERGISDTDIIDKFVGSQLSDSQLEKFLGRIDRRFCHSNTVIDSDGNRDCNSQRANICVVCDRFIIGMEEIKLISKDLLIQNESRLSVLSYEEHFCTSLKRELIQQYEVEDDELWGLLLSPRAKCVDQDRYHCCSSCHDSCVRGNKEERSSPPKFAIANGFAIGYIPSILRFPDRNGHMTARNFDCEEDLTDVICGGISPVRPFGRVFAFHGGKQKSIKGHFSLFSVDQSHVGGVINKYRRIDNSHKNIYVVLCGRMTPGQRQIIQREAELNTDVFLSLLNWFIKSSGHPAYEDVVPPDECPDPVVILQDEETQNNTDESVDPSVECRLEGKTYYFSNESHNPNEGTSVFDSNQQFLEAMLDRNAPTMLMYGGSYLKAHEIDLVDVFPIQFPFGLGGPVGPIERKVPVSLEACLEHYMRLSLNQFMRPDFILVCYHLWCRNASYKTGLIKCKSDYQGKALAEKISQLSVEDIKLASSELSHAQEHNEPLISETPGTSFLQRITTSCKVLGHTTEAAKDARRKVYALTERFGSHSLFFTVTPDDECTFRVRMYANMGMEVCVPSVDCSESECFADFTLRQNKRLRYPGACSIYYQSVIQAVYELLGWDKNRNLKKGKGVFGDPIAICHADEEQGRTTLHGHFLVWLKYFDEMRELLFHNDQEIQERARDIIRQYIDRHFCSDYDYDESMPVIHEECQQCLSLNEIFIETDNLQMIRDGRHKLHSKAVKGEIITCTSCGGGVSTRDMFNSVIKAYHQQSSDVSEIPQRENITLPLSRYRQDIMTYRFMIDELHNSHEFFYNRKVRSHIAEFRMNEHDWKHRKPCFKHGLECRFSFPNKCHDCGFVEDNTDTAKETEWHYVDSSKPSKIVYPYSVIPKRSNGSQYLNTHSHIITKKFGCNSNVQVGSPRCVFYVVHYTTKSTQKEDRGTDYDKIGHQVMKRIVKEKERLEHMRMMQHSDNERESDGSNDDVHDNVDNDDLVDPDYPFKEGLSRFLIGMSVHLSQDVISATMAHLLMSQKGTRFSFSHEFRDLMVGHMINHLTGKPTSDFVLRRRNKGSSGDLYLWSDYSINDYIYRPTHIEEISFYEFGMIYEKVPFTFNRLKNLNDEGLPVLKDDEMYFTEEHPGRRYCCLKRNKREVVPKLSTPNGYISDIAKMELNSDNPGDDALKRRNNYAMVALVLFHPFRDSSVFSVSETDGTLWNKFQRILHQSQSVHLNTDNFFPYGIRILQNMQDVIQSGKCRVPADLLDSETVLRTENGHNENSSELDEDSVCSEYSDGVSLDEFFLGECNDYSHYSEEADCNKRDLNIFKQQCKRLLPNSIINTRVDVKSSILSRSQNGDSEIALDNDANVLVSARHSYRENESKYKTLLGFVVGSLLNNEYGIQEISDSNDEYHSSDTSDTLIHDDYLGDIDWEMFGFSNVFNDNDVPTMKSIAERVKMDSNITLDRIQYVAYEIICSSFMLNMIHEGWNYKTNSSMDFGVTNDEQEDPSLQKTRKLVIERLKTIGAKKQLLMFVTGPAGAGKSTSITVAQKFCYEFCRCLGVKWNENTFLFTATTGCAAALFGGKTIHTAAHLCKSEKNKSDSMKREWKSVKMLIVDEVSMATEDMMGNLNGCLNDYRKCADPQSYLISDQMIFGGYSIIFAGDFRQIPPVGADSCRLLYKSQGLWENSINVAIVLENSHRFSDDPKYGEVLMRMWKGSATKEDFDVINSRLIGAKCAVPHVEYESDLAYACPYNMQRSAIQASMFQRHIHSFPSIDDDELPPTHTIIIEAEMYKGKKGKPRDKMMVPDVNLKLNSKVCERIYSNLSDHELRESTKLVDPALKLYVGANCMINSNDDVSKGIANGSLCRVVSICRKNENTPLRWRNYDGKKVFYINAREIEYVVFEHIPKTKKEKLLEKEIGDLKEYQTNENEALIRQKIGYLDMEKKKAV